MDVRPFRLGLASRAALGAGAGIQHRLQHSLAQRCWQRPAKLRRRKAIEGHGHRAARNPQRSGNRSVRRTAFVLEAQDLSYASHRHSLGWHRSPRSSFLRRAESRAPPSGRAIATPQGRPTSNRNGRDQIGIGGRLHSGISGRLPPEYACTHSPRLDFGSSQAIGKGIAADQVVVAAAMTQPWSNGQTEGQITKLKLVRRQMCGRGKLDLLRARITAPA